MNFLAPFFLLGALAVAAPVIYHLIRRSTKERTTFSSLMFLMPSPPRLTKKSRLEDILLLILRCLALALFALAFARPFVRNTAIAAAGPAEPKKTVVLVDGSASMQRAGLWAAAREEAARAIRAAGPSDEVTVIVFDRQPRTLIGFEQWKATALDQRAPLAVNLINETEPGWRSTNLGSALIAAGDALQETEKDRAPGPREIVLISDLQEGSQLSALQAYEWPKGIQFTRVAVKARHAGNAGLQLVADAADPDPTAAPAARVRITNSPGATSDQFRVGWARAEAPGVIVGPEVPAYVPAGQSLVVRVPAPDGAAAAGLRQIVLLGDADEFDNRVYAVPPEKQEVKAYYFGPAGGGAPAEQPLFYLKAATDSLEDVRMRINLQAPAPGSVPDATALQEARIYFVAEGADASVLPELRRQMEAGKTVVVLPRTAAAGPLLAGLTGVGSVSIRDGVPPAAGRAIRSYDSANVRYAMMGQIEFQHPLFAPFNDPRFSDFSKIHFYQHRELSLDGFAGGRVLAKFDNGNPAIVEIPVGRGRLLGILSGWNPPDSDFAQSSRFVPFIASIFEWSGAIGPQVAQYAVGDALPVMALAGAAEGVSVIPPAGTETAIAAGSESFAATDRPGIYQVKAGARTALVSVNLDAAESRTAPLPVDEFDKYGAPSAKPVANAAYEARKEALLQGSEAEGRQKLWRWFIGITLAVLVFETLLAGWTARRNAASVPTGGTIP